MSDFHDLVQRYIAAWNEDRSRDRRRLLEELCTPAGFDVIAVSADGRIRQIHGFLDKVPGA
jgi:hypothetical protein